MDKEYENVGVIKVPLDFEYTDTLQCGKPQHKKFDNFYKKHPFMSIAKRAKIFAPFSALKGFDGAISDKEIQYQPKITLDENVLNSIRETLSDLQSLTQNSRIARANSVRISVTYFVPCKDKNHESYGYYGQYVTVNGICTKLDDIITRTLTVGEIVIPLDDIYRIEYIE